MRLPRQSLLRNAAIVTFLVMPGCSLTVGPSGASVLSHPTSQHIGGTIASQVRLPRGYKYTLGIEETLMGQLNPRTSADQWRIAGLLGYSRAPNAGGSAVGWEGALRLGLYRGSDGGLVPLGLLTGAKAAVPIRLTPQRDPWERANLKDADTFLLVPELGFNALFPELKDVRFEATAMLGVRYYFSTTLLP